MAAEKPDKALQQELKAAERKYLADLKAAEKQLRAAENAHSSRVAAAAKTLRSTENPPPLDSYGSVVLWEERVQTSSGDISLLEGGVSVEVEARGDLHASKDQTLDTRELYLKVSGPDLVHLEKCDPNQGELVRRLSTAIENAARTARTAREQRTRAIADARAAHEEARSDRSAIKDAEGRLGSVKSEKAALDARREEAGLKPLPDQYFTKGRRRRRMLTWALVGSAVLVVLVSGLAALGQGGAEQTSSAAEADAAPQQSETPTETAPAPPPVEEVDTGRMSDGEYSLFSGALSQVDDELAQYGSGLPKCAVLIQALDLANASDCVTEAYDGLEDDMLGAYGWAEDYEGDVAKGCLKALRTYKNELDGFYGWIKTTTEAAQSLQFDEFGALAASSEQHFSGYRQARDRALAECEPR